MTDKTPSSQECEECKGTGFLDTLHAIGVDTECPSCLGTKQKLTEREFNLIVDVEGRRRRMYEAVIRRIEKEPHDLEETIEKRGERLLSEHKPVFDALGEETPTVKEPFDKDAFFSRGNSSPEYRDAKKCTCRGSKAFSSVAEEHEPDCIVRKLHGDGAKKEHTKKILDEYIIPKPKHQTPALERQALDVTAPQDSLDEILSNFADKIMEPHLVEGGSHEETKSAIQDWHITQVRELLSEIVLDTTNPKEAGIRAQNRLVALERLEDTA